MEQNHSQTTADQIQFASLEDEEANHASEPAKNKSPTSSELLSQAGNMGVDLVKLLGLEVKLAIGDAARIFVLSKVFVQLAAYCWLGLCVFLSWITYDISGDGPWSALVFSGLQVAALLAIHFRMAKLSKSLSLPMTKAQVRTLLGDGK